MPEHQRQLWKKSGKRYRSKHRECLLTQHRERHRSRKEEVIQKYGGACSCCGETTMEFLTIDHENGGGYAERKALGGSTGVYKKLQKNPILPGYRVLCYNCNCALGFFGYCPHKQKPN